MKLTSYELVLFDICIAIFCAFSSTVVSEVNNNEVASTSMAVDDDPSPQSQPQLPELPPEFPSHDNNEGASLQEILSHECHCKRTTEEQPEVDCNKSMKNPSNDADYNLLSKIKSEQQLTSMTGLNSFLLFASICDAVEIYINEHTNSRSENFVLSTKNRVLLTLMKLKQNSTFVALSVYFPVSIKTCSRIFVQTLCILSRVLEDFIVWPNRESIRDNLPQCFAQFPKTRIILDCTEFPVFQHDCLLCRNQTYSQYKGRHTLKIMVGVTPAGLISFISEVYGGKASDKHIFLQSKIMEKLQPNDAVMVDRGFMIDKECAENNIDVIRPSFLQPGESQLLETDAEHSEKISAARVHVERIMERLKNFKILKEELTTDLEQSIPEIIIVIGALVNLSAPILSKERF